MNRILRVIRYRYISVLLPTMVTVAAFLTALVGPSTAVAQPLEASLSDVDRYLQENFVSNKLPGMAVGIVRNGETIYLKGFGDASLEKNTRVTPQTIFDLASVSKSFTALSALLLWHDGLIDLDQPLATYIPEFKTADESESSLITVRELLNQTSGLPSTFSEPLAYHDGPEAFRQLVLAMSDVRLMNPPGSTFEYSNLNYSLLGALVERVSGLEFEDYVQQRIFTPLGMENSTLRPEVAAQLDRADGHQLLLGTIVTRNVPIFRSAIPAGWIMSSAGDMCRWLLVNLNDGMLDGKQVLPADVIRLMHTSGITFSKDGETTSYGMGFFVGKTTGGLPVFWHGGDTPNFCSEMLLLLETNTGIVMLVNGQTSGHTHDIALGVAGLLLGSDVQLPAAPWWASWKSMDTISLYATILAVLLALRLIPYLTTRIRRLMHYNKYGTGMPPVVPWLRHWRIVAPLTPWMSFTAIVVVGFIMIEIFFGYNIFKTLLRFGYFAPPGIIVGAIAVLTVSVLWAGAATGIAVSTAVIKMKLQGRAVKST